MRVEPEVDAFLVEDMVADRQEPKQAVVLELDQANGAFEAVLFLAEVFNGGVREGGERLDEGRIESGVRGVRGSNKVARRRALKIPRVEQALHEAPTEVYREEAYHEEDKEDDREDDG